MLCGYALSKIVPLGVHVAHAIIDGVIDIPMSSYREVNGGVEGGKLDPNAVSQATDANFG
jgi:hypothetical protein